MSDLLSQELQLHAYEIEREMLQDQTPEERRDYVKHQLLVEKVVEILITSRETITAVDLTAFEAFVDADRGLAAYLLDGHYALIGLRETSALVARTLRLAQLRASRTPSAQTNQYIREAAKTYIAGFSMASVPMSRAALEQALKERLGPQNWGENGIQAMIAKASKLKILSRTGKDAAHGLARRCNDVIHERPPESEASAFEVLTGIRSILEELYSGENS